MRIKHIALVGRSKKETDRFYGTLLGLKKIGSKTIPRNLAQAVFSVDVELQVVNYANEAMHFEIFLDERGRCDNTGIEHVCLEVPQIDSFIHICQKLGIKSYRILRDHGDLVFVRDDAGNLFELKESAPAG